MINGFKRTFEPHEEWDIYCEQNETYFDRMENQKVYIGENDINHDISWVFPSPRNREEMVINWRYVEVWHRLMEMKGEW